VRRFGAVLWRSGAFLALWGVLVAAAVVPGAAEAGVVAAHPDAARLAGEGGILAALALASWIMARLAERRGFSWLGFARERAGRAVAAGVVLGAAQLAFALGTLAVTGHATFAPAGAPPLGPLAVAGAAVTLNALTQELLFRGYVFQVASRELGVRAAVLGTSALFALAHLPALHGAWLPAVNVFLAGLTFGLARAATGALWLPTALHATWNVLLGPVLGVAVSGKALGPAGWRPLALRGPDLATGGSFGLEGSFATLIATVPLVVAFWMAHVDIASPRPAASPAAPER
jgi:membrane protease YdiL (CAAX protease family)